MKAVNSKGAGRREGLMKTCQCAKSHESLEKLILEKHIEAVACTAPGVVAHPSALKAGERLKIPSFDPA